MRVSYSRELPQQHVVCVVGGVCFPCFKDGEACQPNLLDSNWVWKQLLEMGVWGGGIANSFLLHILSIFFSDEVKMFARQYTETLDMPYHV